MISFVMPPGAAFLRVEKNGDVLVDVHVVPNASRTQPAGLYGEEGRPALRLRLHAPAVDGKANQALVRWLADCLRFRNMRLRWCGESPQGASSCA